MPPCDRKWFETLLNLSDEAYVIIDVESRTILEANQKACDMFGYSREEIVGMDPAAIDRQIDGGFRACKTAGLRRVFLSRERELVRKDGSTFPAEVRATLSTTGDREVIVSSVRDMTEEKAVKAQAERDRALFEMLFIHSPDAVAVLDTSGKVLEVNPAFCRLFGYDRKEALGAGIKDLIGGEEISREIEDNLERISADGYMEAAMVRKTKDGADRYVSIRGVAVEWAEGIKGLYAIYRDVTEYHETYRNLEREKIHWENLFLRSPLAIALIDEDDRFIRVNSRFEDLFGYENEELVGRLVDEVLAPGDAYQDACELSRLAHQGVVNGLERKRRRKDGTWIDVAIFGYPFGVEGERRAYAVYEDITERKKAEERILYLGQHDGLTGLFNQGYLEGELNRLDHPDFLPLGIVMIDVDSLKLVNDAFGHLEGNRQLERTAELLKEHCRSTDIYGRWGGDEFLLIMPRSGDFVVRAVRDRLRQVFRVDAGGCGIPLSVSVGMAVKEDIRQDLYDVRKQAEEEMYRDKLLSRELTRKTLFEAIKMRLEEDQGRPPHIRRVRDLARCFSLHLGLDKWDAGRLDLLARFHDIGNVAVPRELLERPGPLNEFEMSQIRRHAERGYHIARNLRPLSAIAEEILHHHERYDGTGYPLGLSGEDIPFLSRAFAVIDAFDAMTGYRVYRNPVREEDAAKEIDSLSGRQFDPHLAASFLEMIRSSGDAS
jgi:diguanylate cyclase (GGDEF)-like protein/PAS domain S-box-containing protein